MERTILMQPTRAKEILLKKITMVKNYLKGEWNINLDALRNEIHRRHALLQTKDFTKYEW